MKRFLSLITVLVLILGIAIPSLSLAASAPKTPSIKKVEASGTSVTVSWKAVKGAKGYQIAWGRKGVSDMFDSKATTTGTRITVSGLGEGTSYAFRIRAYYKSGNKTKYTKWSSKKYATTASSEPSVPVISSLTASGAAVTVKWNQDSRADGYEVRWDEMGKMLWRSWADVGSRGSYTATNKIVTGTIMAFQVRAYWWKGSQIKYTSWSSTKYVQVKSQTSSTPTCTGHWSAWGDRSKTRKTLTCNMEERPVYHWWAAKCKSCETHNPYWGSNIKCIHCGRTLPQSNVQHVNIYPETRYKETKVCGRNDGACINGLNYWYCDEVLYEYRYWIAN